MEETLFPLPPIEEVGPKSIGRGKERLKLANRGQIEWQAIDLDSMLPGDHMARVVWEWSQSLDVRPLLDSIRAIEGQPGQNAIDPHILLALWLYATLEGVGSARALERLCEEHLAYRWICGGVGVNYHTLADFRVGHSSYLNQVLIESVVALQSERLVQMKRVAQDGKKIRASAGKNSFHREDTLTRLLEEAKEQVETLHREIEEDPGGYTRRQKAAQERAQSERQARLKKAQEQVEILRQQDKKTKNSARKKERRASSTDPQARVMRMANGGFDPAYNAQFCTDCESHIIVGMEVSQQGNDTGLASPMLEKIETHYQVVVEEILADTSYASLEEIPRLARKGITCYIGVPKKGKLTEKGGPYRYEPEVAAWLERMTNEEGKKILKGRGQVAELVHAVLDQKNLSRMVVRGVEKVRSVLLWFVLAHNLIRTRFLRQRMFQPVVA